MSRLPSVYYDTSATSTRIVRDWRHDALCRTEDHPLDLFHPVGITNEAKAQTAEAKAVCARCPVVTECGAYALSEGIDGGLWGGMTEDERRDIRKRSGAAPAVAYEPCGTEAALKRHERAGERCGTCRRAGSVRRAEQRATA